MGEDKSVDMDDVKKLTEIAEDFSHKTVTDEKPVEAETPAEEPEKPKGETLDERKKRLQTRFKEIVEEEVKSRLAGIPNYCSKCGTKIR